MRAQPRGEEELAALHDPFKPVENGPSLVKIQEYVQAINKRSE
ncbi:hypothetical protein [Sinorhizobium fredii]